MVISTSRLVPNQTQASSKGPKTGSRLRAQHPIKIWISAVAHTNAGVREDVEIFVTLCTIKSIRRSELVSEIEIKSMDLKCFAKHTTWAMYCNLSPVPTFLEAFTVGQ